MKSIDLATASEEVIKIWAKNELDLTLSLSMKKDTMVLKVQEKCKELNIEAPEIKMAAPSIKTKGKMKYVTINIAKNKEAGGAEPVFVGFQGKGFLIPRGIDVAVPEPVEHILGNAKQDIITQDPDSGERVSEEVLSYPYQIMKQAA